MKAGTTSFVDMLSGSDEIYIPPIKEPHYFMNELPKSIYNPSRFFDLNTYFEKEFPKPIHIANLYNRAQYDKLYSLAQPKHKYLVDASTCYLNSPESAKQIFEYNKEAKVIILLRDPLKRAISHYQMDVGLGRTLRPFEEEILDNIEDYKEGMLYQWSYLNMSLYYKQIEYYTKYFGDNVLILKFKELVKSNKEEFDRLNKFLDLNFFLKSLPLQNKTRKLYFPKINKFFIKIGFKDLFSLLVPKPFKHKLFRIISSDKKYRIQISDHVQQELNIIFSKEAMTNRNLNQ